MINLLNILAALLLQIPMADTFRADGKIYVVIAVILIILFGMFFYLFRLDKKVKKLEDEIKDK
ncbi:MAG: CcmD family protein [Cyclobacteriaceae bacterium]